MLNYKLQTVLYTLSSLLVVPLTAISVGVLTQSPKTVMHSIWVSLVICLAIKTMIQRQELSLRPKISMDYGDKVYFWLWQIVPSLTLLVLMLLEFGLNEKDLEAYSDIGLDFYFLPIQFVTITFVFLPIRIASWFPFPFRLLSVKAYLKRLPAKLLIILICGFCLRLDTMGIMDAYAQAEHLVSSIQDECIEKSKCPLTLSLPRYNHSRLGALENEYYFGRRSIKRNVIYRLHYWTNDERSQFKLTLYPKAYQQRVYAGSAHKNLNQDEG